MAIENRMRELLNDVDREHREKRDRQTTHGAVSELAPASGYADRARIANKAEDCILFLRQNKLTTESAVAHIRARLEARKPQSPHTAAICREESARNE